MLKMRNFLILLATHLNKVGTGACLLLCCVSSSLRRSAALVLKGDFPIPA